MVAAKEKQTEREQVTGLQGLNSPRRAVSSTLRGILSDLYAVYVESSYVAPLQPLPPCPMLRNGIEQVSFEHSDKSLYDDANCVGISNLNWNFQF